MISKEELELRRVIQIAKMNIYEKKAYEILIDLHIPVYIQCVIGYYICDLVGQDRFFVLEIDGSSHDARGVYDEHRDAFLLKYGFDTYRLTNNEVTKENIMKCIINLPKVEPAELAKRIQQADLDYRG